MNIHKYLQMALVAVILSTGSILSKSWLTFLENKSDKPVTLQSNDPSSGNGVLGLNGRYNYMKQNPITIDAGKQANFNDFVIPWKTFGAQITIQTKAGSFTLQEDRDQVVFTNPQFPDWNITLKYSGSWNAIGIYVGTDGKLTAKYIA